MTLEDRYPWRRTFIYLRPELRQEVDDRQFSNDEVAKHSGYLEKCGWTVTRDKKSVLIASESGSTIICWAKVG